MKIQDQAVVTMTYVLRENDENGPILQETTKENPGRQVRLPPDARRGLRRARRELYYGSRQEYVYA